MHAVATLADSFILSSSSETNMRRFLISLSLFVALAFGTLAGEPLMERTVMLYDASQGTQVIYLGRSGKTYLWHPSSTQIVSGRWSTRASGEYTDTICLGYGSSKYNPVTGQSDGSTHCFKVQQLLSLHHEQIDGDAFRLASRTEAPFQLSGRTSLAAIAEKAGVGLTAPVIGEAGITRPGGPAPTMDDLCATARYHQQKFGEEAGTTRMLELCREK
jgi:hypothetical protein